MSEKSASQESARSPRSADPAAFEVQVNGEPVLVSAPCRVAGLLESLELAGKRVAVALNRDVVIRSRYADVELNAGDRIEILEAVGGG
jgi:sulfur carrier protein